MGVSEAIEGYIFEMTENIDILYTLLSSGVICTIFVLFWILFVFFCRYVCRRYVCFKEPTPLSVSEESQADVWSISLQENIEACRTAAVSGCPDAREILSILSQSG